MERMDNIHFTISQLYHKDYRKPCITLENEIEAQVINWIPFSRFVQIVPKTKLDLDLF